MNRFSVLLALSCLLGTASADDALDRAISSLGAEDAEIRDAAEKQIIVAGDAAIEICRKALDAATDPEVRTRLKRIVDELDSAKKWGRIWKDRWFRVTRGDFYVGWMHETAERVEVEGQPGWSFRSETEQTEDGELLHFVSDLRCRSNSVLSPVSGRYKFEGDGNKLEVKLTFGDEKVDLETVTVEGEWARNQAEEPSLRWRGGKDGVLENFFRLTERASADRVATLDFRLCTFMRSKIPMLERFEPKFVKEETLSVAGKDVPTRHYHGEGNEESIATDCWFAEDGLVRAHLHEGFGVTMSVDIIRTDEKEAKEKAKK